MFRILPAAGLLAALLLLMATAGAVHAATLNCTNITTYTVYTTNKIQVGLDFKSIGPVLPNAGVEYDSGGLVYGTVNSAQWDRSLNFTVTLDAYAPNQPWTIVAYQCVYNDSGRIDTRYYDVVVKTPNRTSITKVLTVPPTYAQYNTSTYVPVSQPLSGSYCSAPPTLGSWPNCPTFTPEPNYFVSASYPTWNALQVNGYKPGELVSAYGVNATIPSPWTYGVYSDVGTLSSIQIDNNNYGPGATYIPVSSYVYLIVEGMPTAWGSVKAEGASMPLYVARVVEFTQIPTKLCKPPSCIVLTWIDAMPWINESMVNKTACEVDAHEVPCPRYLSIVAVESGATLREFAGFPISIPGNGTGVIKYPSEIRLPLGSVYVTPIYVEWSSDILPNSLGLGAVQPQIFLTDRFDAGSGTPYLRVLGNATYYEAVAGAGKVNGPLETSGVGYTSSETRFAVAVDRSLPSISVNWYVWPVPTLGYPLGVTSLDAIVEDALTINWPIPQGGMFGTPWVLWLTASAWPTDALLRNYPDISGGRYVDLLHLLHGDPTAYYWGSGDQYSAVAVHTASYYGYTTADSAGLIKLYHVNGIAPADAAAPFVPSVPQHSKTGNTNNTSDVGLWLVSLVPTAACRSMFCTSLSPELLGPLPPFPGDRAMPDLGYSIMLTYIGPPGAHDVKVYVGSGYVLSSKPSLTFSSVRNYKLAEINMQWSPMQAVVVGPGWWVPYRPLAPCDSMPLDASSIYVTPDSVGGVSIVINDNGVNYTYVFYVLDDVEYLISTSTPAPASLTGTPLNITAYVSLAGVPYFHEVYGFGEGGRLSAPACSLSRFGALPAPQLALSGDFWGSFGLAEMPLRPVEIRYSYSRPRLELADLLRGLVKVEADGPVSGFAFYAQRNGTWVKIGEARGSCVLVNVSRVFPWDPILVLPLVGQELTATPGEAVTLWRPETALLFKAWADLVGYPKGAPSRLVVVGSC
jgi:hypothetical protein